MAVGGIPPLEPATSEEESGEVSEIDCLFENMSLRDSNSKTKTSAPGTEGQWDSHVDQQQSCDSSNRKSNRGMHCRPKKSLNHRQSQPQQQHKDHRRGFSHQDQKQTCPDRSHQHDCHVTPPRLDLCSVKDSKSSIRSYVWSTMESQQLLQPYPPTCHERIPNFIGSRRAADRLINTREFRQAAVVKVNPSLAQMPLRYSILETGKTLLVPTPALTDDAFMYLVDPTSFTQPWHKKRASSKQGAQELGSAVSLKRLTQLRQSGFKIDLFVVAAVAVCRNGVRLGKGRGFAEMEWAILHEFGLVDTDTIVATTVHEAQLLDERWLHPGLMENHDLPVDLIVTPQRIINAKRKEAGIGKPRGGVLWDKVSDKMMNEIPILGKLREMSKSSSKEA